MSAIDWRLETLPITPDTPSAHDWGRESESLREQFLGDVAGTWSNSAERHAVVDASCLAAAAQFPSSSCRVMLLHHRIPESNMHLVVPITALHEAQAILVRRFVNLQANALLWLDWLGLPVHHPSAISIAGAPGSGGDRGVAACAMELGLDTIVTLDRDFWQSKYRKRGLIGCLPADFTYGPSSFFNTAFGNPGTLVAYWSSPWEDADLPPGAPAVLFDLPGVVSVLYLARTGLVVSVRRPGGMERAVVQFKQAANQQHFLALTLGTSGGQVMSDLTTKNLPRPSPFIIGAARASIGSYSDGTASLNGSLRWGIFDERLSDRRLHRIRKLGTFDDRDMQLPRVTGVLLP
ncbi:MAG: type II toxin-antitoxin system VapC family toxin [Coriobacteriia bacterium]